MARLTIYQDNYSAWRWKISGRENQLVDQVADDGYRTRTDALEAAWETLGDEALEANVVMDGETPQIGAPPPPLPKVDARAEALAAGYPGDPPDVMMT